MTAPSEAQAVDMLAPDDLLDLRSPDHNTVLSAVRRRYQRDKYYTYLGDLLLTVNPYRPGILKVYGNEIHQKYANAPSRDTVPPHVFWVAESALRRMRRSRSDQAILFSGNSGSGKTSNMSSVLQYLTHGTTSTELALQAVITKTNTLLNAFGNARSSTNVDMSCFGKFTQLFYHHEHGLVGAKTRVFMLESSRVVRRRDTENNFHIFHYFLAQLPEDKREIFGLKDPHHYEILLDRQHLIPLVDNQAHWVRRSQEVQDIINVIGISYEDDLSLWSVMAAILHLANLDFHEADDMERGADVTNEEELQEAHAGPGDIWRTKDVAQARQTRDLLAQGLYRGLVSWLVRWTNVRLAPTSKGRLINTISMLDVPGFTDLYDGDLQQLCANLANERLNWFFNKCHFPVERGDKVLQLRGWSDLTHCNSKMVLEMFLSSPMPTKPSLLDIVDEDSRLTFSSDEIVAQRLDYRFRNNAYFNSSNIKGEIMNFSILHFAGQVTYKIKGFREKNRDSLTPDIIKCIRDSRCQLVVDLLDDAFQRPASAASKEEHTFIYRYKHRLNAIYEQVERSQPFFIRCIKPNTNNKPEIFDEDLVTSQFRQYRLLEMAKMKVYPICFTKSQFVQRYHQIVYQHLGEDSQPSCENILQISTITDAEISNTKVFLKPWHTDHLNRTLEGVRQDEANPSARKRFKALIRKTLHHIRKNKKKRGQETRLDKAFFDPEENIPAEEVQETAIDHVVPTTSRCLEDIAEELQVIPNEEHGQTVQLCTPRLPKPPGVDHVIEMLDIDLNLESSRFDDETGDVPWTFGTRPDQDYNDGERTKEDQMRFSDKPRSCSACSNHRSDPHSLSSAQGSSKISSILQNRFKGLVKQFQTDEDIESLQRMHHNGSGLLDVGSNMDIFDTADGTRSHRAELTGIVNPLTLPQPDFSFNEETENVQRIGDAESDHHLGSDDVIQGVTEVTPKVPAQYLTPAAVDHEHSVIIEVSPQLSDYHTPSENLVTSLRHAVKSDHKHAMEFIGVSPSLKHEHVSTKTEDDKLSDIALDHAKSLVGSCVSVNDGGMDQRQHLVPRIVEHRADSVSPVRRNVSAKSVSSQHLTVPLPRKLYQRGSSNNGRVTRDDSIMQTESTSSGALSCNSEHRHERLPEHEEHCDEVVLPSILWDLFRVIPRERMSAGEAFSGVLKCTKLFVYIMTFLTFLFCLICTQSSLILMTTTLGRYQRESPSFEIRDSKGKIHLRLRNTIVTMLQICLVTPHAIAFMMFFFKSLFNNQPRPGFLHAISCLALETVQTLAICWITLIELPRLNIFQAIIIMNSVCLIPGLFKLVLVRGPKWKRMRPKFLPDSLQGQDAFTSRNDVCCTKSVHKRVVTYLLCVAVLLQLGGLIFIGAGCFEEYVSFKTVSTNSTSASSWSASDASSWQRAVFVFSLVLISLIWWENFVDIDMILCSKYVIPIRKWKVQMHRLRQKTTVICSLWNVGIILGFPYACSWCFENFELDLFVRRTKHRYYSERYTDFLPFIINICTSLGGYWIGGFICRVCMQTISYTIPLVLSSPILFTLYAIHYRSPFLRGFGLFVWPEFINMYADDSAIEFVWHVCCCVVFWLISVIISWHLWRPKQNPMDRSEKLFVRPFYNAVFFTQSMMLNRRRRDNEVRHDDFTNQYYFTDHDDKLSQASSGTGFTKQNLDTQDSNTIPMIYACATMWHETKNEITQLLKSIFRMDKDYASRHNLRMYDKTVQGLEIYEFETHIFFDDAFEETKEGGVIPNKFVEQLFDVVDEAASCIHNIAITLADPVKSPTPYGGRLTWKLPGGTQLIVHLKDNNKIRHRKRWSQCMYMYYLLGYRLAGLRDDTLNAFEYPSGSAKKSPKFRSQFLPGSIFRYLPEEIHRKARNTYILTLDGDVDFKPEAVKLLLDQIKANPKVASACGRIHPIGSGPVVWFQQFEYAIGHWLQKAAEHTYGCVLCSPGCFSMFRASALMDDNVMRRYCDKAATPREVIQFDQGEDRWLCTLLIQQGYRVTYCAAADALTFVPESFHEFYNQRRRWVPSTIANLLDLLSTYKNTIHINDNISYLYVFYQFVLLFTSTLAPGTTVMMIAGSYNTVIGTNIWDSHILAIEPVILFVAVCFTTRPSTHLMTAKGLTVMYSIIMIIVIIGTLLTAVLESVSSPNVVFLVTMCTMFFITGLMHPQEMTCLLGGTIYLVCFPSAYILLPLYSLCNLNIVTWGTRETTTRNNEKMSKKALRKKQRKSGVLKWLGLEAFLHDLKEFYKTVVGRRINTNNQMATDNKNDSTSEQDPVDSSRERNELRDILQRKHKSTIATQTPVSIETADLSEQTPQKTEDWMNSERIGSGMTCPLHPRESAFWRQLINIYLHPIEKDQNKEDDLEKGLRVLRTNVVCVVLALNLLWVVSIFQMQLMKDVMKDIFFVPIPRADDPEGAPLMFEPLGFAFLSVFGVVFILQFIASMCHRWTTFCHIIARQEICTSRNTTIGKLMMAEELQNFDKTMFDIDAESADNEMDFDEKSISDVYTNKKSPWFEEMPRRGTVGKLHKMALHKNLDESFLKSPCCSKRMQGSISKSQNDVTQTPHVTGQRYSRYQPRIGHIHVSGNSLQRNFQRRYSTLLTQLRHQDESVTNTDIETSMVVPNPSVVTFDHVYRSIARPSRGSIFQRRRSSYNLKPLTPRPL